MPAIFPTPPTFALPVIVNPQSGDNQFNPIWLQWFLQLAQFLTSTGTGRLKDLIVITATGTYVPSNGTNNVLAMAWGAGGGGGGSGATTASQVDVGSGGGAGGFSFQLFTTGFSNQVFTIGAGGNSGSPGGDTTFLTLVGHGGRGGQTLGAGTPPGVIVGGAGGTSGGLVNGSSAAGSAGIALSTSMVLSGQGASSSFGQGGLPVTTSHVGNNASGYAAGGGGAASLPSQAIALSGGTGAGGLGIVMELS